MGESCSRLDCSTVEDCTSSLAKRPYVFWRDCASGSGNTLPALAGEVPEVIVPQEPDVQLTYERFAVCRAGLGSHATGPAGAPMARERRHQWRRRYVLGRELGAGQTAVVFEAFATSGAIDEQLGGSAKVPSMGGPGGSNGQDTQGRIGRRVALKRFNASSTTMFRQEVHALIAAGVHPHILRLLESFEGGGEEDALVLEYCEGGDVYELYAQNNGCGMSEAFVVALIRQVLLALEHLVQRRVEHRDVKPENLLLFGDSTDRAAAPHIKLADFGWAAVIGPSARPPSVPPEGVGSLWYAPPELNPPVAGVAHVENDAPLGYSDMWSVGVITYLLLVGHSPFNLALRITEPNAREAEVLRLAAVGQINSSTRSWVRLSEDARSFVTALVKPSARKRMSPMEAWNHPFISKAARPATAQASPRPAATPWDGAPHGMEQRMVWKGLDGFQRLGWLAIARAVAEPELLDSDTFKALVGRQQLGSVTYVEELAIELAVMAEPSWFQIRTPWADVLFLAFCYLDFDGDGLLSVSDLARHVAGESATESARLWMMRWQNGNDSPPSPHGVSFTLFRNALWSSASRRLMMSGNDPGNLPFPEGAGQKDFTNGDDDEAVWQSRLNAIAEVCDKFIEEDPGYNLDMEHIMDGTNRGF